MGTYVLKRVLLFIPTFIVITIITFLICRLAPGDPVEMKVGGNTQEGMSATGKNVINEQAKKFYREKFGLDKSLPMQYIIWMGNMMQGDFGNSFKDDRPVIDKIIERLPVSISLQLASFIIIYSIAIPLGILSAVKQNSFADKSSTVILFILYSLPNFWVATLAIVFLANSEYIKIFPTSGIQSLTYDYMSFFGKIWDRIWHFILPVTVLSLGSFAFLSKQMRSSMLEVIRQDYIRTAKAKGLSDRKVIYKHALRNSLIPILTILAGILPAMVGGSFIIETIFSIPGIGQLGIQAIYFMYYLLIIALLAIVSVLSLVGILIADILYAVVDPRIAFNKKSS